MKSQAEVRAARAGRRSVPVVAAQPHVRVYAGSWNQARVHPDADVHDTAVIGSMPESRALVAHLAGKSDREISLSYGAWFDAVIGAAARVGPFATVDGGLNDCTRVDGWVFAHAHVGHDAVVEEGAEVSTHAVIGGHAVVERGARVGLGAVVLPFKRIGAGAIVGAGAVVTRDVPAGGVWAGNPARFMRDVDQARPVHVDPEWYARWAA